MLVYQRVAPEKLPFQLPTTIKLRGFLLLNFGGEWVRMDYDGVFRLPLRARSVPRNIKKQIVQQTAAITQLSRKKQWIFGLSWLFVCGSTWTVVLSLMNFIGGKWWSHVLSEPFCERKVF